MKFVLKHFIYATHLHKTSHKSPNIKWQKIAFYLKMSKKCYFLFSSNNIFWARLFQNICFLLYSSRFFKYFVYFEVRLNDVEIYGFFFNGHFLIIMGFMILCFRCFQNSITLDRKIILTSGFHQFVAPTVLYIFIAFNSQFLAVLYKLLLVCLTTLITV